MKISFKDLGKIAGNFLYLMEKEGIEKTEDLEKRIGTTVKLEKSEDFVLITTRPSNHNTLAYIVSYHCNNLGIPLELNINKKKEYSRVLIKSEKKLKDYKTFHYDCYDNPMQNKIFMTSNLSYLKKELEKLKGICELV